MSFGGGLGRLEDQNVRILDRLDAMTRLEQAHIGYGEGLGRAFNEIKSIEADLKRHEDMDAAQHKTLDSLISMGKGIWMVAGFLWFAFGSLLVSGMIYVAKDAIEQHSQLATLERVVSSHMEQARVEKAK